MQSTGRLDELIEGRNRLLTPALDHVELRLEPFHRGLDILVYASATFESQIACASVGSQTIAVSTRNGVNPRDRVEDRSTLNGRDELVTAPSEKVLRAPPQLRYG